MSNRNRSRSQSSQTSTNTSNTLNLQDIGGTAIANSENVTINAIDGGLVSAAENILGDGFDFVDSVNNNSLTFAAGATQAAIGSSDQARVDSLTFAGGVVGEFSELANQAIAVADTARGDTLDFAAGTLQLIDDAREDSIDFADRKSSEALQFGAGAIQEIRAANRTALDSVQSSANQAFQFSAGAFGRAVDAIEDNAESTSAGVRDFAERAVSTAVNATRSDAAQSFDKLLTFSGYALGALAVVFVLPTLLKRA